jgi:competence protein ComEC
MRDKLVIFLGAILVGGVVGGWGGLNALPIVLLLFVGIAVPFCRARGFFARWHREFFLFLMIACLAGYLSGATAGRLLAPALTLEQEEISGVLTDWWTDSAGAGGAISLTTDGVVKNYALRVYGDGGELAAKGWEFLQPGVEVQFTGKIVQPALPKNSEEFNLPVYYAVRGQMGRITAQSAVTVGERGTPGPVWQLKNRTVTFLAEHWPGEEGAVLGVLFGQTTRLPEEEKELYRATGVYHAFAASGGNVAFVVALSFLAFCFLPRRLRLLATMGVIVFYALLCSGNPPILRATILGLACLSGQLGQGRTSALRWLLLASVMLFLRNPLYLRDVSFLLSCGATWGVIVLPSRLRETRLLQKLPTVVREPLVISLSAQLAILPLLLLAFQRLSPVGLAANVFTLFLLGGALQLSVIGLLFLWAPPLAFVFFQSAVWLLAGTRFILLFFQGVPGGYVWVLASGMPFLIFWYLCLTLSLLGWETPLFWLRRLRLFICRSTGRDKSSSGGTGTNPRKSSSGGTGKPIPYRLLLAVVLLLLIWSPWQNLNHLEVVFLDVGQGDAILVRAGRAAYLIDTGPATEFRDAGEEVILPYLARQGIGELDLVFLSHEDGDHAGGLPYVLANLPVHGLGLPDVGGRLGLPRWQEIMGWAGGAGLDEADLLRLKAGDVVSLPGGITLEVVGPAGILSDAEDEGNDHSLVFFLNYRGYRLLFTGDMGLPEMESIRAQGALGEADFIKIPHHGSKNSQDDTWWDEFAPQAVFVQVGADNSFGHPTAVVLDYWEERGIPLYRTDEDGHIRLVIDDRGFRVTNG